jgi:hypothetical protein
MNNNIKGILTILLMVSGGCLALPAINNPRLGYTYVDATVCREIGFSLLFFVILCVIWAIPKLERKKKEDD